MADENDTLGALDRDVKNKIAAKFDPSKEAEVQFWIEEILGEQFQEGFQESLKSGVRLCALINIIAPGSVKKVNGKEMPFAHRENISNYLEACKKLGMNLVDLFDTQDLYDAKNMVSVVNHFFSLSGYAKGWGFQGPFLAEREIKSVGAKPAASAASKKGGGSASISALSMGSYGVDTGKDPTKVARTGVRSVNEEAKFASVAPADENDTLGALDRDVKNKIAAKYDPEREAEVIAWIEAVTGESLNGSLVDGLHDGKTVCNLINICFPGTVDDISSKSMAFFQRENISKYLDGCKRRGMNLVDLFDTQDLYDNKNIVNVINHFYSFSAFVKAKSSKFNGPFIGVKLSDKNVREFTEEQMIAGKSMVSAQTMGSYGVVDTGPDVKFTHIIKDVDQIKRTQDAATSKAKNMYG
jgi:transgelin